MPLSRALLRPLYAPLRDITLMILFIRGEWLFLFRRIAVISFLRQSRLRSPVADAAAYAATGSLRYFAWLLQLFFELSHHFSISLHLLR